MEEKLFASIMQSLLAERGHDVDATTEYRKDGTAALTLIYGNDAKYLHVDVRKAATAAREKGAAAVADEIAAEIENAKETSAKAKEKEAAKKADRMSAWGRSRNKLFLAACPYGSPEAKAAGSEIIGLTVGDLDFCIAVRLDEGNGRSRLVTEKDRQGFMVSEKTLLSQAVASSKKLHKPEAISLADMARESGADFGDALGFPSYVITNEGMRYGASSVYFKNVLDDVREKVGGDYYIIPNGVHSMVAIPVGALKKELKKKENEADVLLGMAVNNNHGLRPEERMPDSVYLYDGKRITKIRGERKD